MKALKSVATRLAIAVMLLGANLAQAQDNVRGGAEPIDLTIDPSKLTYDILVDGDLEMDDPANLRFKTLRAAYDAAPEGTEANPTVIGIKPNVYMVGDEENRSPNLYVKKDYITFLGLTNNRRSVVLTTYRGETEDRRETGYILDVTATGFTCRNLTLLQPYNVDYEYPGDPSKNITKRTSTITQCVVMIANGDKHVYENVAILSRLDTLFLRTKRSYFKNVFVEGTDDWMGGGMVSVWEDCTLHFPTGGGVCMSMGVVFFNCMVEAPNGMQFYKAELRGMERPVALINCVLPASTPKRRIAWIREKAPPRPNLNSLTYQNKDYHGDPLVIYDSAYGEPSFDYGRELTEEEMRAYNPWNLLRAAPGEEPDNWDPAGVREKYEDQGDLVYRVEVFDSAQKNRQFMRFPPPRVSLTARADREPVTLDAVVTPVYAKDPTITWSVDSDLVTLSGATGPSVTVTSVNTTREAEWVPVRATAHNGFYATMWVHAEPAYTDPPAITEKPTLSAPSGGAIELSYELELDGWEDQSMVKWSVCDDAKGTHSRPVAVSRANEPLKSLALTPGLVGKYVMASLTPNHPFCKPAKEVSVVSAAPIRASDITTMTVNPNFKTFVDESDLPFASGFWTLTGDWRVEPGDNLEHGYGLRPATQRSASMLYQQDTPCGDMQIDLMLRPDKSAGQVFSGTGQPADGRFNADIFIKYDPRTQNGYALRFWRTMLDHKKAMYQLYKIENGVGSPLNEAQQLTGVMQRDTHLTLKVTGNTLTATASNTSDEQTLSLEALIEPNRFGGTGIRWGGGSTGVCGRFEITYPGVNLSTLSAPGN